MNYSVPILFIVFNKIEETKKVFEEIRKQRPAQLFIAADGPRAYAQGESVKCESIKNWIISNIDWECEVKTLFRVKNVGCGKGPSEAITWFFEHVKYGIILEDDCLPNDTFFRFCEELLKKYEFNEKVSIISGNNFQLVQPMNINEDYYYSIFPSSNGWATWKRSWDGFNYFLSNWPSVDKNELRNYLFREKKYNKWWINFFDKFYKNPNSDTWDYQFHYHCMVRKQLAVIPKANLVKNIGYGPDATHLQDPNNYFANVPTHEIPLPLKHPVSIIRNYDADKFIQSMLFGEVELVSRYKKVKRFVKKFIPNLLVSRI